MILISAMIWLVSWQAAQSLLHFTLLQNGITLIYVPAGVRLVILLISGIWGAIGIALAFPLAVIQVFPDLSWQEVATYSAVASVIPYATILFVTRLASISRDLSTLRPIHLPLMAAAVSVTGGLSYTAALASFGRFEPAQFLLDATAMSAGDFLGCFTVVLLVRVALAGRRKSR